VGDGLDIDLRADVPQDPKPPGTGGSPLRAVLAWIVEQIKGWGPALLVVFVIRSIIVEPFQIPSGSMVPTLAIGDFILVSKFSYGLRVPFTDIELLPLGEPERGDVMVFLYPPHLREGIKTDYIKRIVGLPGDTIEVRDDVVYVNGVEQVRTFTGETKYTDQSCYTYDMRGFEEDLSGVKHTVFQSTSYAARMADWGPRTVPEGNFFVMGDNRDHSADSRVWEFVPRENIRGKALFVWLSFNGCDGDIRALGSVRWDRIGHGIR
jgi:signal peptidase I